MQLVKHLSGRLGWHSIPHCMSQCEAFIQQQHFSIIIYTQCWQSNISYTYPTVVSVVDISSLVNKVFHYKKIAFLSCHVQGSILLKRKLQNWMFTITILSSNQVVRIIQDPSGSQIYSFAAWGWAASYLGLTHLKKALEVFPPDTISMLSRLCPILHSYQSLVSHISFATFDLSNTLASFSIISELRSCSCHTLAVLENVTLKHNVRCLPCHCWNSNLTWGHTFQYGGPFVSKLSIQKCCLCAYKSQFYRLDGQQNWFDLYHIWLDHLRWSARASTRFYENRVDSCHIRLNHPRSSGVMVISLKRSLWLGVLMNLSDP